MLKRIAKRVLGKIGRGLLTEATPAIAVQLNLQRRALLAQGRMCSLQRRALLAQGRMCSLALKEVSSINHLEDVEFGIYSQWGEDGIVEWLIQRIPMPMRFVELGVEDYAEANTRFLLEHRNWKGLVLDGSRANIEALRNDSIYWRHAVTAQHRFITAENIDSIIADAGFGGEIGILSIDIDGNDYWTWRAIASVNPAVVICEYNAVFGDLHAITIPYDPTFVRSVAHHSNLYYGASIRALITLGEEEGYQLIGSNRNGVNAFFIRSDLAHYVNDAIKCKDPRPSMIRESRDASGTMTFLGGLDRARLIQDLNVIDISTMQLRPLRELFPLYGNTWQKLV
jgi:hypothetical protein